MGMSVNACSRNLVLLQKKSLFSFLCLSFCLGVTVSAQADLTPISDSELSLASAQSSIPGIPFSEGFDIQGGGLEIDLDIQSDVEAIEWLDDDGAGETGIAGALLLKGVHIGSSEEPISAQRVRDDSPFSGDELAMIHGLVIKSDPKKGVLVTINEIGDKQGSGIDIIVNDIYFGKDLSSENQRGLGLLVENFSNFVKNDYVDRINNTFNLNLAAIDDGSGNSVGNYYPIRMAMQPIDGEAGNSESAPANDLLDLTDLTGSDSSDTGGISDLLSIPGLTGTSMILDAEFLIYMDKIAVYKENWEAGIEGLMIYNGLDTNNDGIEDTIAPVTMKGLTMQMVDHQVSSGLSRVQSQTQETVNAMHFSGIDLKMDIAMENIYIGNPDNGSLGAIHIDDLHIHDTQMWIYPH